MKYLLPLLFLPLFAQSQTITFHEGAGLNPRHIESLGPDSGWVEVWVEVWVGPMAMAGEVVKIVFPDPKEIDNIVVWSKSDREVNQHTFIPIISGNAAFLSTTKGAELGRWINFSYSVKRKKA